MNSWKLFGTAAAAALFVACTATYGQSCGSPLPAAVGSTPVATTSGVNLDLTNLCDPGPFGTDLLYNVSWYSFVAPSSDTFQVETCGIVNYDSRLAVLTDCSTPSSVLACNDDSPGCIDTGNGAAFASKLTFAATSGTTYYIAVGGYSAADSGSGAMMISIAGGGGGDPSCGTGTNDCCVANATAYCSDADCCNTVCAFDAFCCSTAWDSFCASEAATNCAICGGGGSGCGFGTNDCCVANATAFCSDADCCNTVCAFDSFCCATAWDSVCAGEAATSCAICGGGGTGCGKSTNDCCLPNATPGCSDADCCGVVCAADPFCCDTAWDNICAGEAGQMCTACDTGKVCGTATNDCCLASPDATAGCSDAACCAAVCASDPFCCFQEWDAQCAGESATTCSQCAPVCDGPKANVSEEEPCGADMNGGCNDLVTGAVQTITLGDIVSGTYYSTTALRDTDWYEFTVAEGTQITLNLYTSGPALVALTDTTCPRTIFASATTGCPRVATACLPAGTYRAVVLLSVFQDIPCESGFAPYVLETLGTPCDASAPDNDECVDAIIVAPAGGAYVFDSGFATTSGLPLDPACEKGFGLTFVKDLWYSWTPTESGNAYASTCNNASFDTRLACYSDCKGTLVACNDDGAGCGLTSRMEFAVTANSTYLVRVGGYSGGGTGTVTFGFVAPVTNDECPGNPITNGTTPFDTTGSTTSGLPLDPACEEGSGLSFVNDIWFDYTATCNDTVTVSTCNDASYDSRLACYSDCSGTLVACNDDGAGCGLTSSMSFTATSGTHYYIRVGGFSGPGAGNITITCGGGGGGVANDTCATPTPAVTGANAFTNVGAASDAPATSPATCGAFADGFYNDVWFTYTPSFSGTATFSTCSSANFDTRLELWVGCPDAGGVLVACNDDGTGCSGFTSLMTASLSCSTKYLVRVGAYATTGFGSGTLNITPGTTACAPPCPADFNGDGNVDGGDLGSLLGAWGPCVCPQDLTGDGNVDGADLGQLLGSWGACPGGG